MDLGIRGRKAIVCAASQGLGKGCALALAKEGVDVVINARGEEALQTTAAEIRAASGVQVIAVPADVTTAEGRAALLAACREQLPAFMVPAKVDVRVGPLPRNPNGKIDRKSLSLQFVDLFVSAPDDKLTPGGRGR